MAYTERKDAPFKKEAASIEKRKFAYFAARTMRSTIRTLRSFASMCLRAARSFPDGSPVPALHTRER